MIITFVYRPKRKSPYICALQTLTKHIPYKPPRPFMKLRAKVAPKLALAVRQAGYKENQHHQRLKFQIRNFRPLCGNKSCKRVGRTKLIDQEQDKTTRWLKEAIWIRSRGKNSMNKDEGAYKLNNIYDQIILKRQPRSDNVTTRPNKWDCRVSAQIRVNRVPS